MLFLTTTKHLPIFFAGGTKDTRYEPGNIFYDEYRDMEEAYVEEQFFDWINYGKQLIHTFNRKIRDLDWSSYGLGYIKTIKIIDFEMNDSSNHDNGIACFHLEIDTAFTSKQIIYILKEIKECEWIKEYYKSNYGISNLNHTIERLPKLMNSLEQDISMKAWADFIIMYEIFKAHGKHDVFRRINGDVNEMIKGFMFAYPVGCVTRSTIPEGADYYLNNRYKGDILYHKTKDVLGWAAYPEHPGADHLLEFFHWCMQRGYTTMDKVNELINNNEEEL